MKNKWLIILFIFFLGVIILSILISQESQKAVSLFENENPVVNQEANSALPVQSPQAISSSIAALPLEKRGITIIKAPAIEPEEKNTRAPEVADKSTNNVSSQNEVPSAETEDSLQAGITKIGKQPTPKEAQEMNSNGIVLY